MPGPTYSATQLSGFLACSHLSLLTRAVREGHRAGPPKFPDPALEALFRRGLEHEAAFEAALRTEGLEVVRIEEPRRELGADEYWRRYTEETAAAMRRGADVIVQGGLRDGVWVGRPDFLRRADLPSGGWTYEVIDTKLAREAKGGALLQVLLYAHLVEAIHGTAPAHVYLALGGPEPRTEGFRVADYAAYFRAVRERFLSVQSNYSGPPLPSAPDPVEHCVVCAWRSVCAEERRAADHLSLVAGIRRAQSQSLREGGIPTLTALGELPQEQRVEGVSRSGMERIREQARIQLEGRRAGRHLHELLPLEESRGLAALPEPSPGDLFLDFESNPFAFTHGIEYLFGVVDANGDYIARWAPTKGEEKAAVEEFIDMVTKRRRQWPGLHVYHFADHEASALKRMAGFHATREAELDELLRGHVLVDLLRVVKQALRASVESYSIKKLEPLYGYVREEDLRDASAALARLDALLETGEFGDEASEVRKAVERYNRDDCLSTRALRGWLESLRAELERGGTPVPRPDPGRESEGEESPPTEAQLRMARLLARVPTGPEAGPPERDPHWLLAQLLEFHRREKKSFWWKYFDWRTQSEEDLILDRTAVGGVRYEGVVDQIKLSEIHRYSFPVQDHGLKPGCTVRDPVTDTNLGTVESIDESGGAVLIRRGKGRNVPEPTVLVPYEDFNDNVLRESLLRTADRVLEEDLLAGKSAAGDLLLRRPPRLRDDAALSIPGETPQEAACRLATRLDSTVLAIQGPPGAGKTYTGARMIVRAVEAGLRVGITATSHKVISNLLEKACAAAEEMGVAIQAVQRADEGRGADHASVTLVAAKEVSSALASGTAQVAAGTAWLWARPDMTASVDLLFIDEAGQFSLASALAVAPSAGTVVMLGDPRQLEQPLQGSHPPGAGVSALDHLLDGEATIPPELGLFLEETWRLHPEICAFTSEAFYEDRLGPREGLERQTLSGDGVLSGNGLRLLPMKHERNESESPEEAAAVAEMVRRALAHGGWTDASGAERPLTLDDILVVAPYNAQVSALEKALPPGARIGTVDRFQGQEAPLVIYSMATSTPEDAPRGMAFLYSPNRFNVATSRGRGMVVVVASPALLMPSCVSPPQMRLANPLCRYRELATALATDLVARTSGTGV